MSRIIQPLFLCGFLAILTATVGSQTAASQDSNAAKPSDQASAIDDHQDVSAVGPESDDQERNAQWRFKRHNDRWWYWHPDKFWMIHNGDQWVRFNAQDNRRGQSAATQNRPPAQGVQSAQGTYVQPQSYQSQSNYPAQSYRSQPSVQSQPYYQNDNQVYRQREIRPRTYLDDGRYRSGYRGPGIYNGSIYGNPGYGNPGYGNPGYGYPGYGYGNRIGAGSGYYPQQPYYYGNQGGRAGAAAGSAIGGALGGTRGSIVGEAIGGAIGADRN